MNTCVDEVKPTPHIVGVPTTNYAANTADSGANAPQHQQLLLQHHSLFPALWQYQAAAPDCTRSNGHPAWPQHQVSSAAAPGTKREIGQTAARLFHTLVPGLLLVCTT
jgi:hypothetical protein